MNVTDSGANKDAVGAKTKDNSVRDTLAHLMLRNLSEVFGERDSKRRMAAINNLYSEDAVFFEAEQRFEGRQTISDAVAALQACFPAEFEFSAVAPPCPQSRRRAIVLATRSCRLSARRQRDGRCAVQRWPHPLALRLHQRRGPLGVAGANPSREKMMSKVLVLYYSSTVTSKRWRMRSLRGPAGRCAF